MLRTFSRAPVVRRLLAPALVLPLLTLVAHADVDVEVAGKAKVTGSFGVDGGTELIRFRVTRGTTVKATLKAKGKNRLDPGLRLKRADEVVDLGAALIDKGRKVLVKNPELGNTDLYTLEIVGDTTGEYLLKLVTKPQKSFKDTVNVGADPVPFGFSVPPNSRVTLQVKASKSTGITPRLLSLGAIDLVGIGSEKTTSHKATVADVGEGGDMTLSIGSADGTAGPVTVLVKIKAPKVPNAKLDLTDRALGSNNGGGVVFGKAIQPDVGGSLTIEDDPILGGTGITVPADALPSATVITIQSAQQIETDSQGSGQFAGPTLEFQPAGLQFAQDATVTLPFDPTQVPEGFDPLTDLKVLIVEQDGTEILVTPTSVDVANGLVTLPVGGFSKLTVLAPVGPPNLTGRRYWGVLTDIVHEPALQNDESGIRDAVVGLTRVDFAPTGATYSVQSRERQVRFGMERDGLNVPMGVFLTNFSDDTEAGSWELNPDNQRVLLTDGTFGEESLLFVSRDGSMLLNAVAEPDEPDDFGPVLDLFVERPDPRDTATVEALFPGVYHFAEGSLDVPRPSVTGGFVTPQLFRAFGTLVFRANGTVFALGTTRFHRTEVSGDQVLTESGREDFEIEGAWFVEPTGDFSASVVVMIDDSILRLLPDRQGRMFVGTTRDDVEGAVSVYVGVKTSSAFDRSSVRGEYAFGAYGLEPFTYSVQNGPMTTEFADIDAFADSGRLFFDGSARAREFVVQAVDIFRDVNGVDGLSIDTGPGPAAGELLKFSANSDGSIRLDDDAPFPGAFTPDRMFGFTTFDPRVNEDGVELIFAVRLPDEPPVTEPLPNVVAD